MKREHTGVRTAWADQFEVRRAGDKLLLLGSDVVVDSAEPLPTLQLSADVLDSYLLALPDPSQKQTGKNAPHLQFANAASDEELINFVRCFGPVACDMYTDAVDSNNVVQRFGVQSLSTLRKERQLLAAVLTLARSLTTPVQDELVALSLDAVLEGVSQWRTQWLNEQRMRVKNSLSPIGWVFPKHRLDYIEYRVRNSRSYRDAVGFAQLAHVSPAESARWVLCELLDSFPVSLVPRGDRVIQAPSSDVSFGIRPILYYGIRMDLLRGTEVRICANDRCNAVFTPGRADQAYCLQDCERRVRQRRYKRNKKTREDERLEDAGKRLAPSV